MPDIGMNLASVNYWATEAPFIDRFKTAYQWTAYDSSYMPLTSAVPVDANGWPTGLPTNGAMMTTRVALDPVGTPETDRYVLMYSGSANITVQGAKIISSEPGKIVFDFSGSTVQDVGLLLKNLSATDPIHDIHIVREDQMGLFKAGEIFNPEFIEKASNWSVLRFKDWENVDTLNNVTWANRTTENSATWGSTTTTGVPIEVMVKLANQTHTDMWFNIPTTADDTYVRNALTYIRDNLDPALKVKVEYSNEVWNWGYAQSKWAQEQGNKLWGKDANGDGVITATDKNENYATAWLTYYGYRSAQVAAVANSVFGPTPRLENVIATQSGYPGLENAIFDGVSRANVGSAASLFDNYAVTTYFGNSLSNGTAADQAKVLQWARSGSAGLDAAFTEMLTGGTLSMDDSLAALVKQMTYQESVAKKYGLDMVAYEGGAHLTAAAFPADVRQEVVDFFGRLMNDPRMGDLYTKMVQVFGDAGGDELTAFSDAGTNRWSGYWGILDNIYQDSSPRYDALRKASEAAKAATTKSNGMNITTAAAAYSLADADMSLSYNGTGSFTGTGNALANTLYGGDGNDVLDGGAGADFMVGGKGDDVYYVDNVGDTVIEKANEGVDEIRTTLTSFTLDDNLENLTFVGTGNFTGTGNAAANVLKGGAGDDVLDGRAGADTMSGGAGNDTYFVDNAGDVVIENANQGTDEVRTTLASYKLTDNVENLTYTGTGNFTGTGNALANTITGGVGNDVIDGGAGADRMVGGKGNDVYSVDNVGDVVVENANEGTDEVRTSLASYALGANLENLTFTGAGNFTGTGNALANVITGGAANDVLDGGAGADRMVGGKGNDVYYVDNAGDVVVENASEGTDEVRTSLWTYTLGDNVENLTYTGTGAFTAKGNALANVITGGAGNDVLDGGAGADRMVGGAGNDTYYVDNAGDVVVEAANGGTDEIRTSLISYTLGDNLENLTYTGTGNFTGTGNALANTLTGGAGNDVLNGGAGADVMVGGAGNDTYYVDNSADRVIEQAGGGMDTVITTASSYNLSANIEILRFVGTGDFSAIGSADANTIYGGAGNDRLSGMDGNDALFGYDGNDIIDGGAGADLMVGGRGDDTYYVDNTADVIVEGVNEGKDRVSASATYTLSANIEELALSGTAAINGTGNDLDNLINGNEAANTLDGGAGDDMVFGRGGNDILYGGAGNDQLFGGDGNDTIVGGAGNDMMSGDAGNDILVGTGGGLDYMTGGAGADTFRFATGDLGSSRANTAKIVDFSRADGDKIDLSGFDANSRLAGTQAFSFIGTSNFSKKAGELRATFAGGFWDVQGDLNGDGIADISLTVNGTQSSSLLASDFIFAR